MARSKTKAAKPAARSLPKTTKRKTRLGDLRTLVLKALSAKSLSRPDLVKATKGSYNGVLLHLTNLVREGHVKMDASNRIASLVTASGKPATAAPAKPGRPKMVEHVSEPSPPLPTTALVPVGQAAVALKDALGEFLTKLRPIEGLDDKLLVLDQLSAQIGGAIAVVLTDIRRDLVGRAQL